MIYFPWHLCKINAGKLGIYPPSFVSNFLLDNPVRQGTTFPSCFFLLLFLLKAQVNYYYIHWSMSVKNILLELGNSRTGLFDWINYSGQWVWCQRSNLKYSIKNNMAKRSIADDYAQLKRYLFNILSLELVKTACFSPPILNLSWNIIIYFRCTR